MNVALRDPKVKHTRGELHMMAHENSAERGTHTQPTGMMTIEVTTYEEEFG